MLKSLPSKVWRRVVPSGWIPPKLILFRFLQTKYLAFLQFVQVLQKAKDGVYGNASVKGLPQDLLNKHFEKMGDRFYKISDEIKNCVEFKKSNLLKDPYPTGCHLIVCRNVVIYFTEEAKHDIYYKFNKSLVNGGCLFVGNTEQIINHKDLGYDFDQLFFYRKVKEL